MSLEQILQQRSDLWRGRGLSAAVPSGVSTGFAALDQVLPWGGWPPDSLSEVLTAQPGAGLALLLPMLAALGHADGGGQPRWLLLVDPPLVPYAPALVAQGIDLQRLVIVRAGAEGPWAIEQALRSGGCATVIAWDASNASRADPRPHPECSGSDGASQQRRQAPTERGSVLRRLQLAAAAGGTPAVLLRPPAAAERASPAALRLAVQSVPEGLEVTLLKLRGGRAGMRLQLPHVPRVTALGGTEPAAALHQR